MVGTVEQEYEPTSVEEKQERRNEMKARATLLMALPNKDQLKFHTYQDQRLQKLIGQLEIQGEVINQEDMNLKLLRSLPSEWKYHALIWRNKAEIETISLDDLNGSSMGDGHANNQSKKIYQKNWEEAEHLNGSKELVFDTSKVECFNSHTHVHYVLENVGSEENQEFQREKKIIQDYCSGDSYTKAFKA
ncbi:hypothetical protein Tco_1343499 [Tanacetum coccineum]